MEFHFRFDKLIIPACQNQPVVFFSSVLFPNQNSAYEQTKKNNICIIKREKERKKKRNFSSYIVVYTYIFLFSFFSIITSIHVGNFAKNKIASENI